MAKKWYRTDAPEPQGSLSGEMPRDDNGENFITYLMLAPVRAIAGIVSAATIDRQAGVDGEYVDEVIADYEQKFIRERGRKHR